jgi:hypothetical protein
MVREKLKDPNIAATLLPEFITTTPHDRATAAMVFLGTMREYFSYGIEFGCSFPSVTLLGELRPARRRGRAAVLEQRGAPGGRGLVGRPDDAVGVADGVLLVACRWEEGEGLYQ